MTEDDIVAIEQYLGRSLSQRYRELMHACPLDRNDVNSQIALYDDRKTVVARNAQLREGEFESEWGVDRFAIGNSPCGDTYFLDLTSASDTVFVWDHETHAVSEEAPSLHAFVAELKKWEVEARCRYPQPEARRPWWRFWR